MAWLRRIVVRVTGKLEARDMMDRRGSEIRVEGLALMDHEVDRTIQRRSSQTLICVDDLVSSWRNFMLWAMVKVVCLAIYMDGHCSSFD